jgi:hypothetical protein
MNDFSDALPGDGQQVGNAQTSLILLFLPLLLLSGASKGPPKAKN